MNVLLFLNPQRSKRDLLNDRFVVCVSSCRFHRIALHQSRNNTDRTEVHDFFGILPYVQCYERSKNNLSQAVSAPFCSSQPMELQ